jgi:hypothetical protein
MNRKSLIIATPRDRLGPRDKRRVVADEFRDARHETSSPAMVREAPSKIERREG